MYQEITDIFNTIKKLKSGVKYEFRQIKHPQDTNPLTTNKSITDITIGKDYKDLLKGFDKHNKYKKAIYFRPMSPNFLMIDLDSKKYNLDTESGLQKSGVLKFCPFLIVETSKMKFQAWYYHKDITDWKIYDRVGYNLNTILGGDDKSIKSRQVGRLPGYHNYKYDSKNPFYVGIVYLNKKRAEIPKIFFENKYPSLELMKLGYMKKHQVKHIQPTNRQLEKAKELQKSKGIGRGNNTKTTKTTNKPRFRVISADWTQEQIDQYFRNYFKDYTKSQITNMFDFQFACAIIEDDITKTNNDVENIIRKYSKSPDKNSSGYISNTVRNARKRVHSRL